MSEIDDMVLDLVSSTLDQKVVHLEDSPETIEAWDSFSQITLLMLLSNEFNFELESDVLMSFYTVQDLIELVKCKVL